MIIFKLMAVANREIPEVLRGGGKGTVAPIQTPPPLAPEPQEAEMLTPVEDDVETTLAQTKGAKSLQIPLATTASKPLNI